MSGWIALNGLEGPLRMAFAGQDGGDGSGAGLQGDQGLWWRQGSRLRAGILECKQAVARMESRADNGSRWGRTGAATAAAAEMVESFSSRET